MGAVLKEAYGKAVDAAVGFAHDHHVFTTLIAWGVCAVAVSGQVWNSGHGSASRTSIFPILKNPLRCHVRGVLIWHVQLHS